MVLVHGGPIAVERAQVLTVYCWSRARMATYRNTAAASCLAACLFVRVAVAFRARARGVHVVGARLLGCNSTITQAHIIPGQPQCRGHSGRVPTWRAWS